MPDLMKLAREAAAALAGEKGDKGGKGTAVGGFPPLSPFSPAGIPGDLSAHPGWDWREARQLMNNADALVEPLGVNGTPPDVQAAAAVVVSAHATRDIEPLRYAVGEFVLVVKRVAFPPSARS